MPEPACGYDRASRTPGMPGFEAASSHSMHCSRFFFASVATLIQHCLRTAIPALALWGVAAAGAAVTIPPVPGYAELPLPDNQQVRAAPDGELSWLGQRPVEPAPKGLPKGCWAWELTMDRWNAATGSTKRTPLDPRLSGFVFTQLPLPTGLFALTKIGCQDGAERWRFAFLPLDGSPALKLETGEAFDPLLHTLLKLGDDSAALVTRDADKRHIKVYTIERAKGSLTLTARPVLAIPYRGDFAAAVAGQNQLMILGGSNGDYRGCAPCRAETHVLDLKTKAWRDGPPMLEARSELAASTLPDGSVLVTGGWTKAAEWGSGASRTAERWNPATNKFEALPPMPTGSARHKHFWWDAPWGKTLLVGQGTVGAVHSLDTTNWTWRTVGEWTEGSEEGGCGFFPFVVAGNAYAWLRNRSEGHYSSKSCEQNHSSLSLLRPPSTATPSPEPPPDSALITYGHGAAFLPAAGGAPALVIGGSRHAGMNSFVISGAVEAIDRDGRVATLPSLRTARQNARAFRVAGGVLVIGGTGPDSPYGGERDAKPLTAEWLPPVATVPWQWQEVSGVSLAPDMAVSQLKDGSLLAIDPSGSLRQLRLVLRSGKPTLEGAPWPALNRERHNSPDEHAEMRVRELNDGHVVVAGGKVRSERIALYSEPALKPGQPDEYVGIGEFLPWRRYEVFDPATRRWTSSAPAGAAGGRAIVLGDGRVIKASEVPRTNADAATRFVLEVSNPAGAAWTSLARKGSRLQVDDKYSLFQIDDELFASGELEGLSTGGGPSGVEWLNPVTRQWELQWQAEKGDNWRKHQGRVLRRTLTGADGKSKTVLIPVGGL